MKVECPYCKEKYNIKRKQLGMEATCAMCNSTFVLYVEGVSPIVKSAKRKKSPVWIILAIVLFLVLAGGGGAYYYFFFMKNSEGKNEEKAAGITGISDAEWLASKSNLKQIGVAIKSYTIEQNKMPMSLNDLVTAKALTDYKVFIAPFDKKSKIGENELKAENSSYAYIGANIDAASNVPVAFDKPWILPEGINKISVLYGDGSVKTVEMDGVSKMSCVQAAEALTKDETDKKAVEILLKNAEAEDKNKQ